MKTEAQQIAIAKACGWFCLDGNWYMPNGARASVDGGHNGPPDYINDLNAMAEAERVLTDAQEAGYFLELQKLIVPLPYKHFSPCIRATAAHRAEAFLRTVGSWEEST